MTKYHCVIRGSVRNSLIANSEERREVIVEAETQDGTRANPYSGAIWEAVNAGYRLGLEHILVTECKPVTE